jgi:hypothetical protein
MAVIRDADEWMYVYTAIHVHDSLDPEIVHQAITDANAQLQGSKIELSVVALNYYAWQAETSVCFPYDYVAMEEYVIPIQYDIEQYMNIHVMPQFCGGTLGFAFLWYSASQDADGVYVRTDCFGVSGDHLLPDRNENKTLIHELGHYFSLFHTFQGIDYCGEEEDDCSIVNDRVCDTPPTKVNWSCENPVCPPSLYDYTPNNYMDYYVDSCKTTFTMGQIQRMHSVMPVWRENAVRSAPYCIGDVDNDMTVGVEDLLITLSHYGQEYNGQCDFDKNGIVSVNDLMQLLSHWQITCEL